MSDEPRDPRDTPTRPDLPLPGAVRTASPPFAPVPPADPEVPVPPEPEPEIQINLVEEERREAAGAPAPELPPVAPEPPRAAPVAPPVAPDEAETVELAASDLHEAARAAGVEIQPNVDQPDPEGDALAPAGLALVEGEGDGEDGPGSGPIDPRIRERRIAVTRVEGRRRLRILLVAVAIASVFGIAWLVVMSPFLAVDDVTIQGTLHETPQAVRAAADVSDGSALLFVDTGAAARRIEKLPWISEAHVARELPNGLKITVVERAPAGWVRRPVAPNAPRGTQGAAALVDATGRVLGDEPTPPVGLPEIKGTKVLGAPGTRISPARPVLAVALLPAALRAQVSSLTRHDGEPVLLLAPLPGGPDPAADEVRLGRLEDVMAKGAAALAVLDQLTADKSHVTYVDVRVPGVPATR